MTVGELSVLLQHRLAVAASHSGQSLAEIFSCAQVAVRQCAVDQMCRESELAAQTIATVRILSSGNVQPAPEHAVLSSQNGKVAQCMELISACANARGKSGRDLVGPFLPAPSAA